jgi:hypothetical protein
MFLTIPINLYNNEYIIFMDKKKNIILDNSYFTKILYSPKYITINGLCIILNFKLFSVNNTIYNKCIGNLVNSVENNITINKLFEIEKNILENYNEYFNLTKKPVFMINNSFYGGSFKIYEKINKNTNTFIYRISGIWETKDEIGLTYKIETVVD